LDNRFDINLLHFLTDFPMNNRAGTTVQNAANEVKSTAYIQITDIDVPMLVGSKRLSETSSLTRWFSLKWTENTSLAQNTINTRWTCCANTEPCNDLLGGASEIPKPRYL
jgi:hypothetical protein